MGDPHLCLFNRPEFSALNVAEGYTALTAEKDGRLIGTFAGVVQGHTFTSGFSAPFGGPDLVRDHDTVANMRALIGPPDLVDWGYETIRVRCKPAFYGRNEDAVQFALLNAGFRVEACGLNHHIDLRGFEKAADYRASLKREARRALDVSLDQPAVFTEPRDWTDAYRVLEANRARKGLVLSLSLDYVLRMLATFGEKIRMLTLACDDRVCAAALVYEVLPRRLLVVYWGDALHDLPRSPMNLLAYRVVEWAIERGALSLDLGLSSNRGVADAGLVQFKESVGAQPSLRLDMVWTP